MTVSTTVRQAGPFTGNGSATSFPFAFKVFEETDLRVVRTPLAGSTFDLEFGTDYQVMLNADQNENPGGSVVLPAALAAGDLLTIVSDVPLDQPVDLTNQGGFYPESITDALDRATIQVQQLAAAAGRTLQLPVDAPADVENELPRPEPNALLSWDAAGKRLRNVDPASLIDVVAYGQINVETFTGDGVQQVFNLAGDPGSLNNIDISIDGVRQVPGTDFNWSTGTAVSFGTAPPAGLTIMVRWGQTVPSSGGGGGGGGVAGVSSVNGRTGAVTLAKADVGLGSVDNTSDAAKPVSTAQAAALGAKVNTSLLGVANGVATLGPDGLLLAAQRPPGGGGGGDVTGPATHPASQVPLWGSADSKALAAGVPIGAGTATSLLDRQAGDGRYRQQSVAIAQADVTGLVPALAALNAAFVWLAPEVSSAASAAANTAAIDAAITAANTAGGPVRIVLPAGAFNVNPLATITGNNVTLEGQGQFNGGTQLNFTNSTGNSLTVSGQYNVVSGIYFTAGVRRTAGEFIQVTNAFECLIERVRWDYGWNGVRVGPSATETRIRDCSARYMLGENPGILFRGSGPGAQGCYRLTIDNFRCDNPYPGDYSTYKARTNGTAFTAGQMSLFNGGIWYCVTGGTTGSSAPSAVPGTGPADWITTNVTDGSVVWRYIGNGNSCWVDQDSYAYSLVIDKSALINGAFGYRMRDSANTGTSYPIWAFCWDVETDHPIVSGVALTGGEGFFANGSWFGSTLNGNGALIDTTYRGEVFIGGGTRIYGNAQHGVLVQAGPNEVTITGCFLGANSTSSIGTFHGIAVADSASGIIISNNVSGPNAQGTTGYQGRGVFIGNGCSNFNVFGNDLRGNVNSEGLAIGTSPSAYNAFANIGSTISTITASAPNEILSGTGSPEGVVSAAPGTLYRQTDGASGYTLWVKRTAGTGSTGWATNAGSHFTAVVQPLAGILMPLGQGVSTTYSGLGRNLIRHQPADNGVIIGDANERSPYVAITANLVPDTASTLSLGTTSFRFQNVFLLNAPNVSSDARLKREIAPLDPGAMLDAVEAVSFRWNDEVRGTAQRYGWIAQQVRAAAEAANLPDIVREDEDGLLSLDPTAMCAVLWNEVRRLRAEVQTLREELTA